MGTKGGENTMKKGLAIALTLSFTIMLAVSSVSPTSAAIPPGTYTDHQDATGGVQIDIGGPEPIKIEAIHYDSGDLGSGDVIIILLVGESMNIPLAVFTDIPDRVPLFQKLYQGYPTSIQLVNDPSAIETVREGKSKNVHAVWKIALEVPQETWGARTTPALTLPPGMIVFRGHGDIVSGPPSTTTRPTIFTQTITLLLGYYGDATFVCPTWRFGGPVGVDEGRNPTSIFLDSTVVTTIY